MTTQREASKADAIDQIAAQLHAKLPAGEATLVAGFARQFYGSVAADDLRNRSVLDRVSRETARLVQAVSRSDRQKLESHLEGVRAIERRLESRPPDSCTVRRATRPPPYSSCYMASRPHRSCSGTSFPASPTTTA